MTVWKETTQEEYNRIREALDYHVVAGGLMFGGGCFTEYGNVPERPLIRYEKQPVTGDERWFKMGL